jgi:membrane associated rhomboid family serine protease
VPQITLGITLATAVVTHLALRDRSVRDRLIFDPRAILADKEWYRTVTSALLHADWVHFGMNFLSLYAFGGTLELRFGAGSLVVIYLASIVGGSLLSLALHRHHDYRALGASGGVCGVLFASIFLCPQARLSDWIVPIPIPAHYYAILFVVGSYYGIRHDRSNIGHDAHLGGALVGLAATTALHPHAVMAQPGMLAAVTGISLLVMALLYRDPHFSLRGLLEDPGDRPQSNLRYQRYDEARQRSARQGEMDQLLDKISAQGLHSLTRSERQRLEFLSKSRDR